jgi:hypothetical protein
MSTKENNKRTAQSLVLCHYSTTAPALTTLNRSASARVVQSAKASRDAARVYNTILTSRGTAIGKAVSLLQGTGVKIRHLGLPCPMGGIYLRLRDVSKAHNIYDDALLELDDIRAEILETYPQLMADLRVRLGEFVKEIEIPAASNVAARFTMSMHIVNRPAPVDNDVLTGLSDEVANRVRAESQGRIDDMLRAAHAGPLADLKDTLTEFIDKMRNAERLHLTQFDKLRDEARRLKDLNVLGIPEIDEVVRMVGEAAALPTAGLDQTERVKIAVKAEKASARASATLADLGL